MKRNERYVIFGAIIASFVLGVAFEPLLMDDIGSPFWIKAILIFSCIIAPIVILYLSMIDFFSDNRGKRREFEWELALIIARKSEPRITRKMSEIIKTQAIGTFRENKNQENKNIEDRAQIKAKHMLQVWNQLFQEEKEESQK
jgi:hypothetical protein